MSATCCLNDWHHGLGINLTDHEKKDLVEYLKRSTRLLDKVPERPPYL
jgi:hypothetical protein